MPFTISHTAIVVPLTCRPYKYLSATGLLIGSMVPDFLYFFLLDPYFYYGHTWWGIFVYDIPLALLVAFLYHLQVRPALINFAPQWAGSRLNSFRYFNWNTYFRQHFLVVIFSVIYGALTHIFLDAFTHGDGFSEVLPVLEKDVPVLGRTIKMWYLWQYISSVIGLLILFFFFLKIPLSHIRKPVRPSRKTSFWLLTFLLSTVILLLNHQLHYIPTFRIDYLAVIMGGLLYSFLIMILITKKINLTGK
ncbi:MAG TPA: DUF4184 family protein [Chitinophaga sp.]|uniref:DUF4184 family protein n=1 Tax=Chitinophaga sp. TaxID=1869181 RepID=UPI002B656E52|nr:DUF4184 family protein [Chitinophaga sp.]HVI48090.1 DUF4184 family protein [Chitinophaga sp.]